MTNSIPLTAEQASSLRAIEGDWLRLTRDQEEFFRATEQGQVCTVYGDVILRVSQEQVTAAMEVAFKTGCRAALEMLGDSITEGVEITCDPPELGQTYLRVHVVDSLGKKASAIGLIPDPRAH